MINVKLNIDKNKLEAIECYLPEGKSIDDELSAATQLAVDKLFTRYVPKSVREFLNKKEKPRKSVTVTQTETNGDENVDN